MTGESAAAMTLRLAEAKAAAVARQFPNALVIGSDQAAEFGQRIIGKPGTKERAAQQLASFSGQTVIFHTCVAVLQESSGYLASASVPTEVNFRTLHTDEIRRYVELDNPLDCAGSFKSEKAGVLLLRSMVSEDPTAIVGLPLIALARLLRAAGLVLP